ncbi:MAG: ChaN family lipoprotein [Paracoccaceae bacterium]
MSVLRGLIAGAAVVVAPFAWAELPPAALAADVVILGELHDNPNHHAVQLEFLHVVEPKAVIYEMLYPSEAARIQAALQDGQPLDDLLKTLHWSNLSDYLGLLETRTEIIGAAVPPDQVRAAFNNGAAVIFGPDAAAFGLTTPLSKTEQALREDLQFQSHCQAMPLSMMGGMVQAQRLRDAEFARSVVEALQTFGAPVVLITGNGHARNDWGVPAVLRQVVPGYSVFSVGQGEDGLDPMGGFDVVIDSTSVDRADPCDAFR